MYKMKTQPWEHQLKALDFLMVRKYGALYLDMGTGKTKVGIDLIINRNFPLTVIVGTKKSCEVWKDEFVKHSDKNAAYVFRLDTYSTTDKVKRLQDTYQECKDDGRPIVYIINYDSIWRKPFNDVLIKLPIDCVICDESHRIKAPGSKCSLYLTRLGRHVENRFLFTGTPSTETPLDVYAQYRFLQPEIFGTNFAVFRDRYENIDVQRTAFAGYRVLKRASPYKNLEELKEKMYSCAFYVQSSVELPETTDIVTHFIPSKQTFTLYKNLEKEGVYEDSNGIIETNNALVKHLRLQELLSGYAPMEAEDFTSKKKVILDHTRQDCLHEIMENIRPQEKIVIFVTFRHDFAAIKAVCRELGRKYGEISGEKDDYYLWKQGKINTVAVHYKSGSESIDLTQARYCIYYSLSHSYGLYRQSRKRVHRPGQKKPVTYYHIVAKMPRTVTVDQKIMQALAAKQDLVDYLLKRGS